MNTDKIYVEHIANEYSKKKESKIVALKKLDRKAKLPAEIFAYTNGIVTTSVFGLGMCLAMKVIGNAFVLGIVVGIIGMISVIVNYSIYKKILNDLKKKFYFVNLIIFISKIILYFLTHSFAFLISSFYNLGIGLAKRKIYTHQDNYVSVGCFLIFASLWFLFYSIFTILTHPIVHYPMYIGITIATITFYDIGSAIYGIRKSIKNNNKQNKLFMLVNLATAFISLELTQSALLSFTTVGIDNSLYNGIIGIIVGTISLGIGMIICLKK